MIALPGTTSEARACGVKERLFRESYAMCDAPQVCLIQKTDEYQLVVTKIRPAQKAEMERCRKIEIRFGTGTKSKSRSERKTIPHIGCIHEIGRYETYPDYREIEKYTGVLVPENLKIFKERLEQTGMVHMAQKFQASENLLCSVISFYPCLRTLHNYDRILELSMI
ncbi:MAG: hypothetical protein ACLRP8_05970 [Roseburia intestinalis]